MTLDLASPPHRVCLIRLSAIGDACHTLPVVRTLQAAWPETEFTWIIGKIEASLMAGIPGVEFIIFDKSRGWRALADLSHALGGRRFDLLLHMHASMRANLASRMVKSRTRLGFDRARARDYQWLFTTEKIPARPGQHVMDGLFGFAETLGITERVIRWDIPVSDADREFAARLMPRGQPTLVISPCSSQRFRNFRNWRAENYAAVADAAAEHHGARVILTGGPTPLEHEYGQLIRQRSHQEIVDLIGQTTLKQLLAVLERATVLVCPDSGPAHMATTVGTPVIGLYATSNRHRTGPYLSQHLVADKYPEAVRAEFNQPVAALRWGKRVRDPGAMDLISVAEVTANLDRVLGAPAAPAATARGKDNS